MKVLSPFYLYKDASGSDEIQLKQPQNLKLSSRKLFSSKSHQKQKTQ